MINKFPFETEEDKAKIIERETSLGFRLLEVQLYKDGNYLLFTDEPIVEPRDVWKEIDDIKERVEALEHGRPYPSN